MLGRMAMRSIRSANIKSFMPAINTDVYGNDVDPSLPHQQSKLTHLTNAEELAHRVPVIEVPDDVVRCMGGPSPGMGHPTVYITLNTKDPSIPSRCKWCGQLYIRSGALSHQPLTFTKMDEQDKKNYEAAQLFADTLHDSDMDEAEEGQITDDIHLAQAKQEEENKRRFQEMFADAGVTATWKWDDFNRILKTDPDFKAIGSTSYRKQLFNEHIGVLKRRDREEQRVKKQIAKDNFLQMLDASGILKVESKYYRTAHFFSSDPRWRILDEKEREDLFQDYLDDLERRNRESEKTQRADQVSTLRRLLSESKEITISTTWADVQTLFANNPIFTVLSNIDRLLTFSEYITDLETKQKETNDTENQRNQRKNREGFANLLKEKREDGSLTVTTTWADFVKHHADSTQYQSWLGQSGSSPKDIFDYDQYLERKRLQDIKDAILSAIKNTDIADAQNFDDLPEPVKQLPYILKDKLDAFALLKQKLNRKKEIRARKEAKSRSRFLAQLARKPPTVPDFDTYTTELDSTRFSHATTAILKDLFYREIDRLTPQDVQADRPHKKRKFG